MSNIVQAARDATACTRSQRWRDAAFAKAARILSWVAPPIALRRRTILSATISLLAAAAWTPSEAVPPGIYKISTETLMPHLEENLRYAKTRERRCIRDHALSDFFPILRHQSLNGCKLVAGNHRGDAIYYPLVCDSAQETTGTARLSAVADHIKGVLDIQMGGKNMTFSQRVEAKRQGDCQSPQ